MTFSHQRRVEFRDTDAAGIVHFSVFFPMMEEAEHAALRHVGLSVMQRVDAEGHLSWPRVAVECQYLRPARFEDLLRIEVVVQRIGRTSVSYGFEFFRDSDPAPPECLASGKITAVCCHWTAGGPLRKAAIPAPVRSALSRLLAGVAADSAHDRAAPSDQDRAAPSDHAQAAAADYDGAAPTDPHRAP